MEKRAVIHSLRGLSKKRLLEEKEFLDRRGYDYDVRHTRAPYDISVTRDAVDPVLVERGFAPRKVGTGKLARKKGSPAGPHTKRKFSPTQGWRLYELDQRKKHQDHERRGLGPYPSKSQDEATLIPKDLVLEVQQHDAVVEARAKKLPEQVGRIDYLIKLKSRRGRRISAKVNCSSCLERAPRVWRYSDSSRGVVFLCDRCAEQLRRHSFGTSGSDAMHRAVERKRSKG